jgi:hypothetical protein
MHCYEVKCASVAPGLPVEERVLAGRPVTCVVVGERGRNRWEELVPVQGWSSRPTEACPKRGAVLHHDYTFAATPPACPECGATAREGGEDVNLFTGQRYRVFRHPADAGEVPWRRLYHATVRPGRPALAVAAEDSDDRALVLARAAFGFRGSSGYRLNDEDLTREHPAVLAFGRRADGAAGRVADGTELLVVLRPGDRLRLWRTGRLYGGEARFEYRWDGRELRAATPEEWAALEAALTEEVVP